MSEYIYNPYNGFNIGSFIDLFHQRAGFRNKLFCDWIKDKREEYNNMEKNKYTLCENDLKKRYHLNELISIYPSRISDLIHHNIELEKKLGYSFIYVLVMYIRNVLIIEISPRKADYLLNMLDCRMIADPIYNEEEISEVRNLYMEFIKKFDKWENAQIESKDNDEKEVKRIFCSDLFAYLKVMIKYGKNIKDKSVTNQERVWPEFNDYVLHQKKRRVDPPKPSETQLMVFSKVYSLLESMIQGKINIRFSQCLPTARLKESIDKNELFQGFATMFEITKGNGVKHEVAYLEWFGNERYGVMEYHQKDVFIKISNEYDITAESVKMIIEDYAVLLQKERNRAREFGYSIESFKKVKLNKIITETDPILCYSKVLTLDFSAIDYFTANIVRKKIMDFTGPDKNGIKHFKDLGNSYYFNNFPQLASMMNPENIWALCGCGVWIITCDDMLIISYREQVAELPGDLGYSAAGSCEFTNRLQHNPKNNDEGREADPFITIQRETEEETNLLIDIEQFKLISLGLDLTRCLVQFSFVAEVDITAIEFIENCDKALSKPEQRIFAFPILEEAIDTLLSSYKMEPGAVASLIRYMQKRKNKISD